MSIDISEIKGIGDRKREILRKYNILTVEDLLAVCDSKAHIEELSTKTGISIPTIQKWINRANLLLSNTTDKKLKEEPEQLMEKKEKPVKEIETTTINKKEEKQQPAQPVQPKIIIREPYWRVLQLAGIKNEKDIVKYTPMQILQLIYDTNIKKACGIKSMPTINEIIYWVNMIKSKYNV
jgi:transposase